MTSLQNHYSGRLPQKDATRKVDFDTSLLAGEKPIVANKSDFTLLCSKKPSVKAIREGGREEGKKRQTDRKKQSPWRGEGESSNAQIRTMNTEWIPTIKLIMHQHHPHASLFQELFMETTGNFGSRMTGIELYMHTSIYFSGQAANRIASNRIASCMIQIPGMTRRQGTSMKRCMGLFVCPYSNGVVMSLGK